MDDVLLVTVDSLRADHVGWHGYDRPTTPNLDARAEGATVFTETFAHACSTRASFPTILTSTHPLMYGGYKRLSESRTLISKVLADAGYRTAGFHSNAYLNPEFGYKRGFDHFHDSMTDPEVTARLRQWVTSRLNEDGLIYQALASAVDTAERRVGANIGSAYVDADKITDHAIEWLREAPEEPTFLWVHYMDVHHPYLPPATHQRPFRKDPIGERRAVQLRRKFIEEPDAVTDAEFADIIDLYDAEIRFTDAEIKRLLQAADDHLGDYTLAVTADHGEEFYDHGGFSHRATFYDEVVHVPLLVDAGGASGDLRVDGESGRCDELVGLMDVVPTLASIADLNYPDSWCGYDLTAWSAGEWPREAVLGDWSPVGRDEEPRLAYRDYDWKYIVDGSPRDPDQQELYDLHADPGEQTDVSDDRPEVVNELREHLADHDDRLRTTTEELGDVEMSEEVVQQLRDLGYKQ